MKNYAFATIVASVAIALSGCGSADSDTASPEDVAERQEQTPSSEPTPLTQAEWAEMCLPDGTDPENPRCTEDMDLDAPADASSAFDGMQGEWVLYRTIDSESIIHDWSLRIDSVEVTDSIEGAADNPEYYSGDNYDAPERITAEANDGMDLLHVVYTARNDGMEPDMLPVTYAVIFSDGEVFAPTGDDDDYGYNLTIDRDPGAGQNEQNPRSEAQGDIVIEIPENSEIAAIEVCDPYIDSGFCTTIELTDVD